MFLPNFGLSANRPRPNQSLRSKRKVLFSCQVKGEQIAYCGGDNKKGLQWLRFKQTTSSGYIKLKTDNQVADLNSKTFFVTEENQQRSSFTTVHFEHKGLTYSLTKCVGMSCVAVMDHPWFAVYNGKNESAAIFATKVRSLLTLSNLNVTSKVS